MLQVGVHDYGAVGVGTVEAGEHGVLLSEVARQTHIAESCVVVGGTAQFMQRAVGASVVDENHLPDVLRVVVEHLAQFEAQSFYVVLLVVAGDYDADGVHFFFRS